MQERFQCTFSAAFHQQMNVVLILYSSNTHRDTFYALFFVNLLTLLGDNSSDRWLWRLPWSYYVKYGKLLSQRLLSSNPLLKVSSFCSDLKDYYQSAGNALYIVSTQVLWLQTTLCLLPVWERWPLSSRRGEPWLHGSRRRGRCCEQRFAWASQ